LTADEIATAVRLAPSTIHNFARIGRIPAVRVSRKTIRFRLDDVMAALAVPQNSARTEMELEPAT
jgi:excisionase family DNA binding protein